MPAALDLAIKGHDHQLQTLLLANRAALEEPLRSHALERADDLLPTHRDRLGRLLVEELAEDPEQAARRLTDES